jgi:hypothetical protein
MTLFCVMLTTAWFTLNQTQSMTTFGMFTKVVDRFRKFGIKFKASKLKFGCKEMPFLGVIITENGIKPNPEKVKAIREIAPPKSLKQLRRILGIFAYYRKFIKNFSERAQPLYEHTKKSVHNKRDKGKITLSANALVAFEDLKAHYSSLPRLGAAV